MATEYYLLCPKCKGIIELHKAYEAGITLRREVPPNGPSDVSEDYSKFRRIAYSQTCPACADKTQAT